MPARSTIRRMRHARCGAGADEAAPETAELQTCMTAVAVETTNTSPRCFLWAGNITTIQPHPSREIAEILLRRGLRRATTCKVHFCKGQNGEDRHSDRACNRHATVWLVNACIWTPNLHRCVGTAHHTPVCLFPFIPASRYSCLGQPA